MKVCVPVGMLWRITNQLAAFTKWGVKLVTEGRSIDGSFNFLQEY
jgi:hypothetical protein